MSKLSLWRTIYLVCGSRTASGGNLTRISTNSGWPLAALLFAVVLTPSSGWAQSYNAAAAFEHGWTTQSNPNGVWSYGYSSGFTGPVTLYDQTAQPGVNGRNAQYWLSSSVNIGESPSAEYNDRPAYDDGNVDFLANEFVLVAGIGGQYSDLVFSDPADGAYSVVSEFRSAQYDIGHAQKQDAVAPASQPADSLGADLLAAKLRQTIALGDFNGDGIMDVAVADFLSDAVLVMLGDGAGGFRLAARLPSSGGPRSIVAADFNHDGLTDLAVANFFSGAVTVFLGRGDGTFEEPRSFQLEKGLASIVSADFDADGIPDLAVANFFSGQVVILKGAGDGTFEARSRLGPIGAISFLHSARFDNTRLADLVAFDASGKKAWLIAGERGGSFKGAVSVDPKAAVALISTQEEPTNGILPTGEPRRLKKVAGDGQSAPAGSLLAEPLIVEIREQGGRSSDCFWCGIDPLY